MNEIRYVKACDCVRATATCGRIVLTQTPMPDGSLKIEARQHPGPVCDQCDTPWVLATGSTKGDGE